MIVEEREQSAAKPNRQWLRLLIGTLISGATIWFILQTVTLAQLVTAIQQADLLLIGVALLVIVVTGIVKAHRWQLLFYPPDSRPSFAVSFWAIMLNQFVNNVFFGRFGEIARALYASRHARASRAQALGTIIVEKWLDLFCTLLIVCGLLFWAVALPVALGERAVQLAVLTLALLAALYLLAFRTRQMLRLTERLITPLPQFLRGRLLRIATAGLEGLAALREPRLVLRQLLISLAVSVLYVLTPLVLFAAFDLPYTLTDAILLNVGVGLIVAVPSVPGKFGVFEVGVFALLKRLNPAVADSTLLSYALLYHLIIILPPLLLGGWTALRSDWRWRAPL